MQQCVAVYALGMGIPRDKFQGERKATPILCSTTKMLIPCSRCFTRSTRVWAH